MGKLTNFFDRYEKLKAPVQILFYMVIAAALIGTVWNIFFKNPKVYITNFMKEDVAFHDKNYCINISEARTIKSIEYTDKKGNIKNVEGNFIKVSFKINQFKTSSLDNHKLDFDDFKLKDHSGVYVPMNNIMTFFDINAVDMHLTFGDNESLMSNADFSTKKSINDYSWFNEELSPGKEIELTIYFNMSEGYSVEHDAMIFEIDFFSNFLPNKLKNGTDILLCLCVQNAN